MAAFLCQADAAELEQLKKVRITPSIAGLSLSGPVTTSIWAAAFSPDQKSIALGVQSVAKKNKMSPVGGIESNILLVDSFHPETILRRFAVSRPVAIQFPTPLFWSNDGQWIAGSLELYKAVIINLATGVTKEFATESCTVKGILAGPRVVMDCIQTRGAKLRFLDESGNDLHVPELNSSGPLLAVELQTGRVAAFVTDAALGPTGGPRDVRIYDAVERKEIKKLALPPSAGRYIGAFANQGNSFCTLALGIPSAGFSCWDLTSDRPATYHHLTPGFVSGLSSAGGSRITFEHTGMASVPKFLQSLADTTYVMTRGKRFLWDVGTGQPLAIWPSHVQWLLPGVDGESVWAVAADGRTIVDGGGENLTFYRVRR